MKLCPDTHRRAAISTIAVSFVSPLVFTHSSFAQGNTAAIPVGKDVFVLLDITGSFVEHLLAKDLWARAMKRVKEIVPQHVEIGSDVRVGMIGHSHRDVTGNGTYDHLDAKNWRVTRNQYTKERVASAVFGRLEEYKTNLENGQVKRQQNTAVAMAFDHIAEMVRMSGKPSVIIAISDMDETEYQNGLPPPAVLGALKGSMVYAFGAGVTLTGGSPAQRMLKNQWDRYFKLAGVDTKDFYWIANP
jgi:hypothetical protein